MVRCLRCGEDFPENKTKTFKEKTYCLECYPHRVKTCCECGAEFFKFNGHTNDDKWYCDECFHEHYQVCSSCNEIITEDESFSAEDEIWCESCYCDRFGSCSQCGDIHRTDELHSSPHGNSYCRDCFSDRFFRCERCHDTFDLDDACGEDNHFCSDCYQEVKNPVIHDYGYKPDAEFKKLKWDDELFMGVELEVQYITAPAGEETEEDELTDKAGKLKDFLTKEKLENDFYFKADSSVESGFEIVSHPFTLQYGHKNMKWYKIMNWLKRNSISSQETGKCGLHVHINKKMFTDLDISKLRLFFSRNAGEIIKFSKRKEGREDSDPLYYCKFENWDIKKFIRNDVMEGRYWALNLNSSRETVEIRIFRGTLNHERFLVSLQFCHAVSHFVKIHGITSFIYGEKTYKGNSWKLFTDWCKEKTEYNHLAMYLQKEKLCV